MADRRHAVTQLDFFIRQVTLFADEIRNAVGQKLDVLGFKTTGRDLGEQMAFGFLLEFLQKVVVILCDRFACHRIQRLGKILLGETVCIRQALGQGLFHFIGKLPVRRMNLFASSLAYIKEIVKSEFGIPVDTNGYALCTGNQISAYACSIQSNSSPSKSDGLLMTKCVVHRPGYGSVFAATRSDSNGADSPSVSTK